MGKTITFLNNNSVANITTNFQRVNNALEDVLSLSGELPNSMSADLDMNSNDILNVGTIQANDITIDGTDATGILERALEAVEGAEGFAEDSENSAIDSAISASEAAGYAASLNLPEITTGTTNYQLNVNIAEDGYDLLPNSVRASFTTVTELLADTSLDYTRTNMGDIIEAQGFRYEVAASVATDGHLETAGGVKLYVLPVVGNTYWPGQFNVLGDYDGSSGTNNLAALQAMAGALPAGATVDWGRLQVYCSGGIVEFTKDVEFTGVGAKVYLDSAYFDIKGSMSAKLANISAAANANDTTVSVSSTVGLAEGDLVILHNHVASSLNEQRPYYYDGEFQEIKSVGVGTLTFERSLETSYAGVLTDEVYRVDGIRFHSRGVAFEGDEGVSTPWLIRVQYGRDVEIDADLTGGNTRCIYFDKCYSFRLKNGTVSHRTGGTGSGYGVSVGNSQFGMIFGARIHGDNHSIAMGGNDQNGSVPCRHVYIEECQLSNSSASQSTVDIHGNAVDCGYRKNVIYGSIGLSGHDCFAIGNKVIMRPDQTSDWPFTIKEIGGGRIEYSDNKVYLGPGYAGPNRILAFEASSLTEKVNTDFVIAANRNVVYSENGQIAYFGTLYYNGRRFIDDDNTKHEIRWHVECKDNVMHGDISGLTNVLRIDTAVSSVPYTYAAIGPATVSVNEFTTDTPLTNAVKLCQTVVNAGAGGFGNTLFTLPEYAISGTLTIPSGASQSGNLTLDHPEYPGTPEASVSAATGYSGVILIQPVRVTASATQSIARLMSYNSGSNVASDYSRNVQLRVGMTKRKIA